MTVDDRNISVHRVGVLAALHFDLRAFWLFRKRPTRIPYELRYLRYRIRERNWRAVRNHFDGWRAEHAYAGTRAGHGWTRRRALADLRRHLEREVGR